MLRPPQSRHVHTRYDSLGNVQALGYPQCIAGGCGAAAGADSVTFNYSRNLMTSVPGYADAITYQAAEKTCFGFPILDSGRMKRVTEVKLGERGSPGSRRLEPVNGLSR